jgi:hypothetical protein
MQTDKINDVAMCTYTDAGALAQLRERLGMQVSAYRFWYLIAVDHFTAAHITRL